jgi:micrococcal nuclease
MRFPDTLTLRIMTPKMVVLAATALLLACATTANSATVNSTTTLSCPECQAIPVIRVIDGDTFVSADATIRLYGADTPERGETGYKEATERLRELADNSVRVEDGPRKEDRYRRHLYYVYDMDGNSIDEMLVRESLAEAWEQDGQHKDVLLAAEERAKKCKTSPQ